MADLDLALLGNSSARVVKGAQAISDLTVSTSQNLGSGDRALEPHSMRDWSQRLGASAICLTLRATSILPALVGLGRGPQRRPAGSSATGRHNHFRRCPLAGSDTGTCQLRALRRNPALPRARAA
jgi:hypothetical protein